MWVYLGLRFMVELERLAKEKRRVFGLLREFEFRAVKGLLRKFIGCGGVIFHSIVDII